MHLAAYYGRTESAQMLLKLGANINVLDRVNGQTPLHIAVMQSQTPIITLLRNSKADVTIQDRSGNTAASYANSVEIRDMLVNPAVDIVMKVAQSKFAKDEQQQAIELMESGFATVPGCLSAAQALDLVDATGYSTLMQAIIHSNWAMVKTLVSAGANVNHCNPNGVSCAMFANWINNPRIKALLPPLTATEAQRLESIRRGTPPKLLFLGPPPTQLENGKVSDIGVRMNQLFLPLPDGVVPSSDYHTWCAKVQMFTVAASNMVTRLSSQELFALGMTKKKYSR